MLNTCPQCSKLCDEGYQFCPSCGYPIAAVVAERSDPLIGSRLAGGYVILECIGGGGMGRVYRAEQTALGRSVAVKIIHPNLLTDESAAVRFITEARTASLLNHPNSVSVIDFGKHESGQLYIVMEYLRGKDLGTIIYEQGPLPFLRVIDIVLQVLAALSEAHHLGIVHRDLKPENIMVESLRTGGDFIKVVDFGLAKLLSGSMVQSVTVAGMVCGTPEYMSPEQARGDQVDSRSDLYAVGVILFHLLTNRVPFDGDTPRQVVLKHVVAPMPDPREVAPDRAVPDGFLPILTRAMQKDRNERYQDADSMAVDLMQVKMQLQSQGAPNISVAPESVSGRLCPACGESVPMAQRFCGSCGARLVDSGDSMIPAAALQAKISEGPSRLSDRPISKVGFVGRSNEIGWLLDCYKRAHDGFVAARVVGPAGMGKTSLLFRFFEQPAVREDVVISVGPDPWGANIPLYTLRDLIRVLLAEGDKNVLVAQAPEPVVQGLELVFDHGSARLRATPAARDQVTAALRWSLQWCYEHFKPRLLVLCVHDLDQVDGTSRGALGSILRQPPAVPLLILADHAPGFDANWPADSELLELGPLESEALKRLQSSIREVGVCSTSGGGVMPMRVEQVARYVEEGGTNPPAHVVDVIALRVARLDADVRRVLQAMAVLGHGLSSGSIQAMLGDSEPVDDRLAELERKGMVFADDTGIMIAHPLIQQVTAAITPAAVRRELHERAYDIALKDGAPREVRAMHALHTQHPFDALLLLDQIGEDAMRWGDWQGAETAFDRCFQVAEQQLQNEQGRQQIDESMDAVVIFARKLADAFVKDGKHERAQEVMKRALDIGALRPEHKAKLHIAVASFHEGCGQLAEAMPHVTQGIALAHMAGDVDLVKLIESTALGWQGA